MSIGSGFHSKKLLIPSELIHMMDDVEFILLTYCRLLNAAEVSIMAETCNALTLFVDSDVATLISEGEESSIENFLDVGIVFLLLVLG